MTVAPKCRCGRVSLSLEVKKPGPNRGKWFWRCPTQSCGYFQWDTSASKFTVHPTSAYALAEHFTRTSPFAKKPIALNTQFFTDNDNDPNKDKTEIEFCLHSPTEISIRADHNPTLLPALQKMENSTWNDDLQRWMLPATAQAYARSLQQITVAPNLNLHVIRLSNALKQVLREKTGLSDFSADMLETDVEEAIYQIRESALWKALKPFQQQGVRCALKRQGRLLLADEVGKEMQALAITLTYKEDWPVLIICPKGMESEWLDRVVTWLPILKQDVHITKSKANVLGKSRKRKDTRHKGLSIDSRQKKKQRQSTYLRPNNVTDDDDEDEEEGEENHYPEENDGLPLFSHHTVYIINNELANRFSKELLERHFRVIICDQTQDYLKFRPKTRSQSFIPTLQNCRRLILLCEEFNLEKPFQLYTQLTCVRHDLFPDIKRFGVNYCNAVQNVFGWDYSGTKNRVELQYIVDNAIWLKRTKKEIKDQLPVI
ncbi:hypothetical protein BDA99DRAFT_566680 [Phascolomyces articulosus]|uniref:GRF-type domain-containing protein n=1 Tax=Phascolomyces articulosus TaxID=60185 RepID=A0AAD5P6S4_9FUNG|nr:hypothetical protein BDA99DRAFT_566680 [Phascolomyces articulosus]